MVVVVCGGSGVRRVCCVCGVCSMCDMCDMCGVCDVCVSECQSVVNSNKRRHAAVATMSFVKVAKCLHDCSKCGFPWRVRSDF